MMKLALENKIYSGFGLAVLILSIIGITSYLSIVRLVETSQRVEHVQQVLVELEVVLSHLSDAETGERGYLITGKEAELQPYYSAKKVIYAWPFCQDHESRKIRWIFNDESVRYCRK